jgi:hypothetical protein
MNLEQLNYRILVQSFYFFLFAILFTGKCLKAFEWNKSSVECIGVEQGLSQNTVNCIYKDKEGFI